VKADITSAQVYVGYGRILSPMDGIVTSKQAEVGLLAAPGVPLLTLEDHSRYRLEVSVEDSMIRRIRPAMPVRVVIDALGPQEFSRRVTEIVPASDPGSRSSTVKVDLSDDEGKTGVRRACAPAFMEGPVQYWPTGGDSGSSKGGSAKRTACGCAYG